MKSIFFALVIIFFSGGTLFAHPVHVSVVNVVFEDSCIRVQINSFIDDWETAYFHYHGKQTSLRSGNLFENEWFNEYFHASFRLAGGDGNIHYDLVPDTIYYNDLTVTIKMHARLNNHAKSLYIYNAILTDIFADQNNLFIITVNDKEKGIKFDVKQKEEVLKLE